MFILEVSYSLLLLHFCSREHISTCFHFAFYKADYIDCQDPFPLLPFMINKGFFHFFSSSDLVRLRHTGCCVSFQGDGEEPIIPHRAAFVLLPQPSRTAEWAAAVEPLLLPQGSGSSPPHSHCQAGEPVRLLSLAVDRDRDMAKS